MFDVSNLKGTWTMINFVNNNGYDLHMCTFGVIPLSKEEFLLCGGFDGKEYKKDVYKVNSARSNSPVIDKTLEIPNEVIFMHNYFCKIGNSYYNADIGDCFYEFDYSNWKFNVFKP